MMRLPRWHTRPRGYAGDRGSVTLEVAILFPVVLIILLTITQAALWFHARELALAAAQEGVRAGRVDGATTATGIAGARTYITEHAARSLYDTNVSATGSTETDIHIVVTGRPPSLLPGLTIHIRQQARGPRERFTSPR